MTLLVWNSTTKPNHKITFVFLIAGGGGGCDDVRMTVENHYSIGKTLL